MTPEGSGATPPARVAAAALPPAWSMRDVLAAGGQVGRDLLDVDWATTSVGEPDAWPLSLRNAVRILLTSRFSMWMAWGADLTFFCNDAYRRDTLGEKYPWALGRPAAQVWSEIWADIESRIDHVMTEGEATWDEALQLFLQRSGYVEESYHTFSYSPLADDDGVIAGMLCVVAEVTEQVVAERRMTTLRDLGVRSGAARTVAAAVAEACAHLERGAASLPFVAVYLFDGDGRTAVRAGTAGISTDHAAAPPALLVDDDASPWPAAAAWRGETSVVDLDPAVDPTWADLPTGAWAEPPLRALVVPVTAQGASGHPYGLLVVGLNRYRPLDEGYAGFVELVAAHLSSAISDARTIEAEKERAEGLARLDQAKTDFLTNVSHELRTPLTLLLGPAEDALADTETPLGPPHRDRLEVVARNGQRMLQLVNTLLDFSRLEAGHTTGRFERVDLVRETTELVGMFASVTARAGLALRVSGEVSSPTYVDREHWATIVLNLLSNAVKFTFDGAVTVTLVEADGRVELRVADTGEGIAAQELKRLFDRFHRVRGARSRSHEGSGVGLALVAELAALHGGSVAVASEVGVGTTFTVTLPTGSGHLPLDQVAHEPSGGDHAVAGTQARGKVAETMRWLAEPAAAVPGQGDGTPSDTDPRDARDPGAGGVEAQDGVARVLVVDDNADMRGYVGDLLRGAAYDVSVAVDGVDALEQMTRERPDLVLTDVMMPRLDGFGLLRAMQAEPLLATVPVVMLSARGGEEATLEGLEAGADDYLVKPFSARELLARVRVNLELDRAERVRDALLRSEELLDQAQGLARIGSWEIDLERDTIMASRTFLELMEHTQEDFDRLGTAAVIGTLVHPDDLARVTAELAGAVPGHLIEYETRIVLPSGGERLFLLRGRAEEPGEGTRVLRGSFQDITEQRATQRRLVAAEAETRAAARERLIADELQRSLLPDDTFAVEALDLAAFYRSGTEGTHVGGDWYDVVDLGAGRTALVVGDVMGRGVRAAAVMGQLRAAVRAFARMGLAPADVLEQLDGLVQDLAGEQIVTCVYSVFDASDQTLSWANAGHLPVVLAHPDGRSLLLEASGPPLGAGFFGAETRVEQAHAGSTLVLYTDGLVERRDGDLDATIGHLAEHVVGHVVERVAAGGPQAGSAPAGAAPGGPTELADGLAARFAGDAADDDIAVVVARVVGSPYVDVLQQRFAHRDVAPAQARHAVAERLRAWGVPAERVDDLVLATSELVTNALVHARPPIDLRLQRTEHELLLEVSDHTVLRPRRRRPDDADEHGRGLNIVEAVSDDWGTRITPVGKAVWCSVRWAGPEEP